MDFSESDVFHMKQALKVAERALQLGEVPVGCVLVLPTEKGDVMVSHGANQVNATRDATRHAEIVAIDRMLTQGSSSDQLRLPPEVYARPAKAGSLPEESPLLQKGELTKLKECFDDFWTNDPTEKKCWKNKHGWGSGRTYTEDELKECRLYVTCEPCIMCAAALAQVGISKVIFGCSNPKFGGCGSILSLHDEPIHRHHTYPISKGLLEEEAISLLRNFYDRENFHAPDEKRKRKD